MTIAANGQGATLYVAGTLVEAGSGTHSVLAGVFVEAQTITAGAGAATIGASVYIAAPTAPVGAGAYSLYVASGVTSFADNQVARAELIDFSETTAAPSISGGTLTADYTTATTFRVALNANITTFNATNPSPTTKLCALLFIFTADGTPRTIVWPTGTVWPGGIAPTMTSTNAKRDLITLITTDAGTTWYGLIVGQNL